MSSMYDISMGTMHPVLGVALSAMKNLSSRLCSVWSPSFAVILGLFFASVVTGVCGDDGSFKRNLAITDLGVDLIAITPGTFQMGQSSRFYESERPMTSVTLTKLFWLGKTEVTQFQWQSVMGKNPSNFKGANLPVERVSWRDAMEFCRRLTERERTAGRLPEGYVYMLPTEAQWEYACRAGTTDDYAGDLDKMGWYNRNSGNTTHPVGKKQANAWGLYDMHGNVWEWCLDWYKGYTGGSVRDPTGPSSSGDGRITRGGDWTGVAEDCRSANRNYEVSSFRYANIGFRLALSPEPN